MRQLTRKQTKRRNEAYWAGSDKTAFRNKISKEMRKEPKVKK